jgi:hypothetical protein
MWALRSLCIGMEKRKSFITTRVRTLSLPDCTKSTCLKTSPKWISDVMWHACVRHAHEWSICNQIQEHVPTENIKQIHHITIWRKTLWMTWFSFAIYYLVITEATQLPLCHNLALWTQLYVCRYHDRLVILPSTLCPPPHYDGTNEYTWNCS